MPKIFICYRREDTSAHAGRLADDLQERFRKRNVFMDIHSIRPGEDFKKVIEGHISSADATVVLIGRRWLELQSDGRRRIDDEEDYVRVEVETALRVGKRVVPALVDGARMADRADLPESIRPLVRLNAINLDEEHWREDVKRLSDALGGTGTLRKSAIGAVAALALVAVSVISIVPSCARKTVPLVIGRSEEVANHLVGTAGLVPRIERAVSSEKAGTVIRQSPMEGAKVRSGTTVVLTIAAMPPETERPVEIPAVVGRTARIARSLLTEAGLTPRTETETSTRPPGTVIRQSPIAGTRVARGAVVEITISEQGTSRLSDVAQRIAAKAAEWNLGDPRSGMPAPVHTPSPRSEGYYQHFARGSVYWSPHGDAHMVWGLIFKKWEDMRWEQGVFGFPLTDELPCTSPDSRDRYQRFEGGVIYWKFGTREAVAYENPTLFGTNGNCRPIPANLLQRPGVNR